MPDVDRIALIAALEGEGLLVTEWTDDPGASYEPHTHEQLEVRIVIEGSMTIVAGGRELVLRPGDRIDIAPRQPHAAHVGPEGVRYLAGSLRLQSSSLR